ncbi:hypothetical protein IHC78_001111 [Salmonella enterica subsp. houtenae]|nr:hypothetical protein [Salmonella enterica subsp. houtenae]
MNKVVLLCRPGFEKECAAADWRHSYET